MMGRHILLLLQLQACGAFLAPPARAVTRRVLRADEAGDAPAPPPTPEEEAALVEMLTAKFAASEGSTYGAYKPEDLEPDADDSVEAELRRRVPASERRASAPARSRRATSASSRRARAATASRTSSKPRSRSRPSCASSGCSRAARTRGA